MAWKHYDVIMTSLPIEVPSGGETSSEERDITLLKLHKKSKGFSIFTGILAI